MSDKDEGSQTGKKSYLFWLMLVIGVICGFIIISVLVIFIKNQKSEEAQSAPNSAGLAQKESKKEKKLSQKEDNNKNANESGLIGDTSINSPFNLIEKPIAA